MAHVRVSPVARFIANSPVPASDIASRCAAHTVPLMSQIHVPGVLTGGLAKLIAATRLLSIVLGFPCSSTSTDAPTDATNPVNRSPLVRYTTSDELVS